MNKSTNTMTKVLLLLLLAVAGSAKAQGYQSYYLLCEYKDGEQIFVNQEFEICYIDDVSVREQIQQQMEVSLYPNPAKEKVMIKGIKPAEVQFYNVLGQMVKTVKNSNEINVAGLPEGIYLLHITNTEGKVYTNKITIQ